jgi:hypothetical protein
MSSTSLKAKARQNLLVATVNAALEQGLITLDCAPVSSATFEFTINGHPVIAYVHDIGFDEVSIKATVCPTPYGRQYVASASATSYRFRRLGEGIVNGWLERRSGASWYFPSGTIMLAVTRPDVTVVWPTPQQVAETTARWKDAHHHDGAYF